MSLSDLRLTWCLGLIVGAGWVVAGGCESDDKKVSVRGEEGGEGGFSSGGSNQAEGGQVPGSAGAPSNAGEPAAAGVPGAGGAPMMAEGGAGGVAQAGAPGTAGAPALECPTGDAGGLTIDSEPIFDACRGGRALIPFSVVSSDQQFTCCGTSSDGYSVEMLGLFNNDGGGDLSFLVPAAASATEQTLTIQCSGGLEIATSISVGDEQQFQVTAVTPEIAPGGTITLTGVDMMGVNYVRAIPVEPSGQAYFCVIDDKTETTVTCHFGGDIAGGDYVISAFAQSCGSPTTPGFTVLIE